MWNRVKELAIYQPKYMWIVLLIQLVCLIFTGSSLLGHSKVYQFSMEDAESILGKKGEKAFVDESFETSGLMLQFSGITLPRGVYKVQLDYETNTDLQNICTVVDETGAYKRILTNGTHLYAGLNHTNFDMWVLRGTGKLAVQVNYNGSGRLTVKGLKIVETNAMNRIDLFIVVCLIIAVNGIFVFRAYDKKYVVEKEIKITLYSEIMIGIIASIPLFTDYIISSGDIIYHLMRIEGIKDGILNGQFPVRIAPEWQAGYGYASSIFYGELFLYPAAILRLIGFTVNTSYKIYMVVLNIVSAFVTYFCFKTIFQNRYVGIFCSAVYSLSIYRIFKTYCTGSLGETLGILLLPIVLCGFYKIYTEDVKSKGYTHNWIWLTVGFGGIVQSHLLTGELALFFAVIVCIVLWKRTFRKETFLVLVKSVVGACIVSAWFLIPFVEYMVTGDFVIKHVWQRTIQSRGLYPAQLLFTFFTNGNNVFPEQTGMSDSEPMGIGIVLIAGVVMYCVRSFVTGKNKENDINREKFEKMCACLALMAMGMSLSIFPWDIIQKSNRVLATLVSSIQFPNRCLTIATILLTAVSGVELEQILKKKEYAVISLIGIAWGVFLLSSSVYLMNEVLKRGEVLRIYNSEGMGTAYISGAEYLPYKTDPAELTYRGPYGEQVEVEDFEKYGLSMEVSCQNISDTTKQIQLPLLYYRGYQAWDKDTKMKYKVIPGENMVVSVTLPEKYQGELIVQFVVPWYWRMAEIVSAVSVVAYCILRKRTTRDLILRERENKKNAE